MMDFDTADLIILGIVLSPWIFFILHYCWEELWKNDGA